MHVSLGRSNLQPVPLNESLYPLPLARWLGLDVSNGSFKGLQQRPIVQNSQEEEFFLPGYSHIYPYSPPHLNFPLATSAPTTMASLCPHLLQPLSCHLVPPCLLLSSLLVLPFLPVFSAPNSSLHSHCFHYPHLLGGSPMALILTLGQYSLSILASLWQPPFN